MQHKIVAGTYPGEERRLRESMATKAQHDYAVYLFQQGFYVDTVSQLDELLRVEETAERWSDWATAQFGLNRLDEAERGFRRALELNPELSEAAVNFGMLRSSQGRFAEALELFERAQPKLEGETRSAVLNLIEQCRAQLGAAQPNPVPKSSQPRRPKKVRRSKARR